MVGKMHTEQVMGRKSGPTIYGSLAAIKNLVICV
jgi:hypothetical protein